MCAQNTHVHTQAHTQHAQKDETFISRETEKDLGSGPLYLLPPTALSSPTGLFQIKQAVSKLESIHRVPTTHSCNRHCELLHFPILPALEMGVVVTHESGEEGREFRQSSEFWP